MMQNDHPDGKESDGGRSRERDGRRLSCWADGPGRTVCDPVEGPHWWAGLREVGSTCLLEAGHEGRCVWTPDDEIDVEFADAGE